MREISIKFLIANVFLAIFSCNLNSLVPEKFIPSYLVQENLEI